MKITKRKIERPFLILMYGPDKTGKSTFAASAPNPLFLQAEEGSNQLDVFRYEDENGKPIVATNWIQFLKQVEQAVSEKHIETIVIDTLDWVQALIYTQVCAEYPNMPQTIAEIAFGKGYPLALKKWHTLIDLLNKGRDSGKNIILLAHSVLKKYEDPTVPNGYDRYQLNLYDGSATSKTESTADLFKQYVDAILFANFKVYAGEDKRRAFGDGTRVIYTERRPAFDAGNRFGLPPELPLDWDTFVMEASPRKGEAEEKIKKEIQEMIGKLTDEKVKAAAVEAFPKKKSLGELAQMKTKLEGYLAN